MAKTRGDLLTTSKGQIVGKQQLYALLTDADGNAVLDANGNEQLVEMHAGVDGSIRTSVTGSLATEVYPITPDDLIDLPNGITVGLYVGIDGDVALITDGGTETIFKGLAGGMIHPISCKRVKATGTSATDLLAVY